MASRKWTSPDGRALLFCGDCREKLALLPAGSIAACITDPPYPEIKRDYGRWTEEEWHTLMASVVAEIRSCIRNDGSAMFVLQPNSETVGSLRPWLWKFLVHVSETWNVIQDVWWWNPSTAPTVHCQQKYGLLRPSMKACVWVGNADCYRNQAEVLLDPSESAKDAKKLQRHDLQIRPSGMTMRDGRALATCAERGGATPFNVIVCSNTNSRTSGGAKGHGAATPLHLLEWWVRYISKPNDVIVDPFCGSGTTGVAAMRLGRRFIGIEQNESYFDMSVESISKECSN